MKNKKLIVAVSILIPIVVAILLGAREPLIKGYDLKFLPGIYATINGVTAILLVLAFLAIKKGQRYLHEKLVLSSMGLSVLFLLMYVLYHITTPRTEFGDEGIIRYIYLCILASHILLSVAVIPLVLFSIYYAKNANFVKHRKIVKWSFPIWLYIAVSGVIVYLMISPYYA